MVFAYSTNAFVRFSLLEAVDRIAGLGFCGVELMGDRPHLYPPDFDRKDLLTLQASLSRHGLKVTNLNSFTLFAVGNTYLPSWIESDEKRRRIRIKHTLDCLRVASDLGSGNISIPPGGPLDGIPRAKAVSLFHSGLEQVIPMAEELQVKLLIEPEPGLLIENTRQFKKFIQEVGSPAVGLNFDIGHFYCVGEDPCSALDELFRWVGHIHVEDIAHTRIHHHLIPGHGAIPFMDILVKLHEIGYRGDMSLELYPYVDMPEEAGREGRSFLLPLLRESGLQVM